MIILLKTIYIYIYKSNTYINTYLFINSHTYIIKDFFTYIVFKNTQTYTNIVIVIYDIRMCIYIYIYVICICTYICQPCTLIIIVHIINRVKCHPFM
jgi:hypothetical protein